ncbi:MAG: hypothetical protein IPH35_01705 [Rhodoferax sp.]|nr:hypothetical protein [Rhodoferax sp.]
MNGLKPDSRLRPVPGHTHIPLTLEAVATQGPHYWLPGGKLVAQSQHQHKKTTRLVLDSAGNHTSVDFWVDL